MSFCRGHFCHGFAVGDEKLTVSLSVFSEGSWERCWLFAMGLWCTSQNWTQKQKYSCYSEETFLGPHNASFAQRLDLGWVVIGEVCLGNVHKPTVNTFKTNVLDSGCHVKETQQSFNRPGKATERMLGQTVFNQTEHDNKPAPSLEETIFLKIMMTNVYRDDANSCVAPVPFIESCQWLVARPILPDIEYLKNC
ncbi:hypothetical protein SKAU_G00021970 [Synaphobranchus kaupii]|uniref:Uncharacterized protein n=1 Tax=Synaphobranchus kaupii TaxID=118154 RepID=A0A9Q1JEP7_SYNKA|nr:hypothetical protein SKAU_G00021970 [Synaphobranchus kaupii]